MEVAPWGLETSLAPSLEGLGLTRPDSRVRSRKRRRQGWRRRARLPEGGGLALLRASWMGCGQDGEWGEALLGEGLPWTKAGKQEGAH